MFSDWFDARGFALGTSQDREIRSRIWTDLDVHVGACFGVKSVSVDIGTDTAGQGPGNIDIGATGSDTDD